MPMMFVDSTGAQMSGLHKPSITCPQCGKDWEHLGVWLWAHGLICPNCSYPFPEYAELRVKHDKEGWPAIG